MKVQISLVLALATALAYSQTAKDKALIKLIGAPRAKVDQVLGKPERVDNSGGGGEVENWGEYPKVIQAYWNADGKMSSLQLISASNWKNTLKKYGLSASGVKAAKTGGDGGSVAYKLTGVKGIPTGWTCTWYVSGLSFNRKVVPI